MASPSLPGVYGWGNFLALCDALGLSPSYGEGLGTFFLCSPSRNKARAPPLIVVSNKERVSTALERNCEGLVIGKCAMKVHWPLSLILLGLCFYSMAYAGPWSRTMAIDEVGHGI